MGRRVFVDSCAVNRFALINVNPVRALAGGAFALAVIPALEAEYREALDHLFVPPYVKGVLRDLLERCERHGAPAGVRGGTDAQLLALSRTALVVTDDAKLHRLGGGACPGMVPWSAAEAHLRADGRLADLLARVGWDQGEG